MPGAPLIQTEKIGAITVIKLNRPEQLNAFNAELCRQFNLAIADFINDDEARVGVVMANGRAFSAGKDIKEMTSQKGQPKTDYEIEMQDRAFTNKPLIAAIHGPCYGVGMTIAMACDLRIASTDATFCLPETKFGGLSIHANLLCVKALGMGASLEFLLAGDPVDAQWADETGLVNRVVEREELESSAMAWASAIALFDPQAISSTKQLAEYAQFNDFDNTVDLGLKLRKNIKLDKGNADKAPKSGANFGTNR